jgi:SAM-dependent methyltransferase
MSIRDHRGESVAGYANYQFYAERDYWERRYLADAPYEWWCGAAELLPLLDLLLPRRRERLAVLDLGCGTSNLLAELRLHGFSGPLTGVDFSAAAIQVCREEAAKLLHADSNVPSLPSFLVGDASELLPLGIAAGSQDVVIEKGTLSGVISSPDGERLAARILQEVHRVLNDDGGMFLSIQCEDPNDEDESKNGIVVLEELILPPLLEAGRASLHYYTVDVHSSDTFRGCHVYVLRKKRQARTRAALRGESTMETVVRLHEH